MYVNKRATKLEERKVRTMTLNKTENELKAYLNNEINEYDILTHSERRQLNNKNAANSYGISKDELLRLCKKHQRARENFDVKTMAKIEYRLTDINFHYECGLLFAGRYEEAFKACENW